MLSKPIDDYSTSTIISSNYGNHGFIDFGILMWVDSMILIPPSSSTSVPSSNQPMEGLTSLDSGTLRKADILKWIDSLMVTKDGMVVQPSPFASGSSINHPTMLGVQSSRVELNN